MNSHPQGRLVAIIITDVMLDSLVPEASLHTRQRSTTRSMRYHSKFQVMTAQ